MVISSPIAFKSHGSLQEHNIPESRPEKPLSGGEIKRNVQGKPLNFN